MARYRRRIPPNDKRQGVEEIMPWFLNFGKKPKVTWVPSCSHDWELTDVNYVYVSAGVEIDVEERFTLHCSHCKGEKLVDLFGFNLMKKHSLIKEG